MAGVLIQDKKDECRCSEKLIRECDKLDPVYEQWMAEEGLSLEVGEWPEY